MKLTDMMSAVISGIFSISMISITIFSLVSNDIQKKALGLSLTSLKRYYIYAIFAPLIILIMEMMLIVLFPNFFNSDFFAVVFSSIIVLYLIFHAIKVLQPYYSPKVFKDAIIKARFKKNKNKRSVNEIIVELTNLKNAYLKSIENKSSILYDDNDIKELWNYYTNELKMLEVTKEDSIVIFNIKNELFPDDFYDLPNGIKDEYYIEYLIEYRLKEDYEKTFEVLFEMFHSLFGKLHVYSNNNDLITILLPRFVLSIDHNKLLINCLLKKITNNDWNKKDAIYLHIFIHYILLIKETIMTLDITPSKIEYLYNCYEDNSNYNEKFGRNYDAFLKTCFKLIREDQENETR